MQNPKTEAERAYFSKMYAQTHHCSSVDRLPSSAAFVVLQSESRTYTDPYHDTNPSGMGTTTDYHLNVIWFETEEALNWWILQEKERHYSKPYKVFYLRPVEVEIKSSVHIKES